METKTELTPKKKKIFFKLSKRDLFFLLIPMLVSATIISFTKIFTPNLFGVEKVIGTIILYLIFFLGVLVGNKLGK